jgi:uncharacterized alpha-E superfamily protein
MLSRVADNLFWMGRYLERSEHLARFLNVQYFSSIELPYPQMREQALLSVLNMAGTELENDKPTEEEILFSVGLDGDNPASILSAVYSGRENARSVRDSLSTEVWEAFNRYYLFVSDYPVSVYKTKGLDNFTTGSINHCAIVKGKIHQTLLRNETFHFLQIGKHIERAIQILRIMLSKMEDINEVNKLKIASSLELQQWNIILDCLEAKDMCRKHYHSLPNKHNTVDFLLFTPNFPFSVAYNLGFVYKHLQLINKAKDEKPGSLEFKVGKIINDFRYTEIENFKDDIPGFLQETLDKIYLICNEIHNEYFKY